MSAREIGVRLRRHLGDRLLGMDERSVKRVFVEIRPEDVTETTRLMLDELRARFQTATGIDTADAIELLYHWALDRLGCVVTVRTRVSRESPEVESIASMCPAAEWIEREVWELLGVNFHGHPDLRHLLLGDDWPPGKHPLRRDYRR